MKCRILKDSASWSAEFVATAIHAPGDIVVYGGFAGVYTALQSCAVGQLVTIVFNVIGRCVTASGVTFAAGAAVYWDTVNNTCVASAGANIVLLGTALLAKVSGELETTVKLGQRPL